MEYHNIDGTGWPDAVVVDNGGDVFDHTYAIRTYYPVDRDALLALADEMRGYADGAASGDGFPYVNAGSLWSYADRIREACGVDDGR